MPNDDPASPHRGHLALPVLLANMDAVRGERAERVPMKPYYQDESVTLYHGDCRELAADLEFDVVATDPPYGTGQKIAYDVYKDTMPQWLSVMDWLLSLPHPTVFTMAHTRMFDLPKRPQWIGCWDKVFTGGIVHVGASPTWEPVCFYNLPAGDRGQRRWDDIFRVPPHGFPFTAKRDEGHPCPKPVNLYRKLLTVMPDGVVLDPMMGSGTTIRAAKDVGRRAIGIDLSEKYCELAAQKLSQGAMGAMFDTDPLRDEVIIQSVLP